MSNYFDQFDPAPAPQGGGATIAPAGNVFDAFDEPVPEAAPKPTMGQGEALMRGAKQGASLNLSDEIVGAKAASGLPEWAQTYLPGAAVVGGGARYALESLAPDTFGQEATGRYTAAVEAERAANKTASQEHPGTYFGGELGGGLVSAVATPMLAPFRAAQAANMLARGAAGAGNLATTGAVYGGVAGAGAGEGDLIDRLPSAAQGAAVGGVAAPVIGGAIRGVGAAGRFVGDHVRATRNPQGLADDMVSRALQRDTADAGALADDMQRANSPAFLELTPPDGQTMRIPRTDGGGGQAVTLADMAGANTQGIVGSAARQPGPARQPVRQFLEDRQIGTDTAAGQGDRVSEQVGALLGNRGAIETADAIMARRSSEAEKLYGRAYQVKLNYETPEGQSLLALLDRVPNAAKAKANEILNISDRDGHQMIWNPVPNEAGGYALATAPNGRQWDYIKRGLDTIISDNANPMTGELNTLGGAVAGLKTEILSKLDTLNPAFGAARKVYAGDSELLDALRLGQRAFQPGTTDAGVTKAIQGMSPGEAEMYRLGAANALRDRLGNAGDGADKVRLAYGSPALRSKIAAMSPDKASRDTFAEFVRNEGAMNATRSRALGGSPTAERIADDADNGGMVARGLNAAQSAARGNIGPIIAEAARHLSKVSPTLRGKVLDEARKVILNPDPATVRAFVERVNAAEMRRGTRERIISTVTKALPRFGATAAGG